MKLSKRMKTTATKKRIRTPAIWIILGGYADEVAKLEAKLMAVECGECGKTLLECDFAECDKEAMSEL